MRPIIVWFRQDLRVADHAALHAAASTGAPVIPVYVLDEGTPWAPGGASRWWLHYSLQALSRALRELGAPLVLRRGATRITLSRLAGEVDAAGVYWSRSYEPAFVEAESALQQDLARLGIEARRFAGVLLCEPEAVRTATGQPFKVFTPFSRAIQRLPQPRAPTPAPAGLAPWSAPLSSDELDDWDLLPRHPDWAHGLRSSWTPGAAGAAVRMQRFLDRALAEYPQQRDRPDLQGGSRCSPHLHFGELSPRQLWHAIEQARHEARNEKGALAFQRQLLWREFSYHLLSHAPQLPEQPLRADFANFSWRSDRTALQAWQQGRTGYPIVDAGMRELWHTGWMHNRVRMIVASFLVKHLLVHWSEGERWFWDTLVDADLANNATSWQWVAGSGTDAVPYFRIFNPVTQARRFDPHGSYVRRWVPELAKIPAEHLHAPWLAPGSTKDGIDYPAPIVDHAEARARALAAYQAQRRR